MERNKPRHLWLFCNGIFKTFSHYIYNEEITVYKDVAWATFYWTFDATFKADNRPLQTKGRETQIWRRLANEWHWVHVHYSNMPVTVAGKGF